MTEEIIEINSFLRRESLIGYDAEDPMESNSFSTCEEKRILLKTYHSRRYFGKHIPLLWRNNEPILTLGPHWPLFLLTWCGLIAVGIFVIVHLSWKTSPNFKVATICVTLWQGFIYLLVALKNPGIVTAKDSTDPKTLDKISQHNFCKTCKIVTSKDMSHCSSCKVCIRGFDHHCPWTGKCIGAGNWWTFYAFLFSTGFYIIFCMVTAGLKLK